MKKSTYHNVASLIPLRSDCLGSVNELYKLQNNLVLFNAWDPGCNRAPFGLLSMFCEEENILVYECKFSDALL